MLIQMTAKKTQLFILDTSAILSGKLIDLEGATLITTLGVSNELSPGGRDYQLFQFLIEKGLAIQLPSKESINKIKTICQKTGDTNRLSNTDIEILALALDKNEDDTEVIILTDDYSIQNAANELNIRFETISQSGITKRFKWTCRCRGCGKKFKENISICPICGAVTKNIVSNKKKLRK